MKSKLSLTLPLFFCSYNSPKNKKAICWIINKKKKFLKQLKLKKEKRKKIEAIKCCNKIKLKMLDY